MEAPKIKDVAGYLESIAPIAYQEAYDNCGLQTGDPETVVAGILITLDCTEAVVEEAIRQDCNLILSHHPVLFKGLKKIIGSTYVERVVMKAIKNNVAIYSAHTNFDNIAQGVNQKIAEKIGLIHTSVLQPRRQTLSKLVTFIPGSHLEQVLQSLHEAGAGQVGKYADCSFRVEGKGTFKPDATANPFIGTAGKRELVDETRVEVIFPMHKEFTILNALRKSHPYEEVAFYITRLENLNQEVGSGLIGELKTPEEPISFLRRLKVQMNASIIRHTRPSQTKVAKVAVCGGAGSFLLQDAISQGADAFISADFKYHEFFDADGKILVADIGHYESEQFTKELFFEVLSKRFSTFAINFSKTITNPISYL